MRFLLRLLAQIPHSVFALSDRHLSAFILFTLCSCSVKIHEFKTQMAMIIMFWIRNSDICLEIDFLRFAIGSYQKLEYEFYKWSWYIIQKPCAQLPYSGALSTRLGFKNWPKNVWNHSPAKNYRKSDSKNWQNKMVRFEVTEDRKRAENGKSEKSGNKYVSWRELYSHRLRSNRKPSLRISCYPL